MDIQNKTAVEVANKKLVQTIAWVAKALSHDKERFALRHIQIKDGVAVATDGSRFHRASVPELAPFCDGLYTIAVRTASRMLLVKCSEDVIYPNWTSLLRLFETIDGTLDGGTQIPLDVRPDPYRNFTVAMSTYIDLCRAGVDMHPHIWAEAVDFPGGGVIEVRQEKLKRGDEKTGAILVVLEKDENGHPSRFAILMPLMPRTSY